ncbi:sugar transferase [Phycicoccus sp. SLBN-51]|uniref:sugar transferase n=1 Tax=Phycicoccus sp. SLBN-51 TaxID=2768447 RepID=UPI001151E0A9|nr:sugar transferase [Phycicoccus sp. SLBN-51]TQJ52095.1 Undecaprenyl-phosphate galactose phosphotransferase WbaP/exopolysaccharide biosynthesis polyprenyl glycosylphosphotransferase [Phycicoccus sp. SLBN-51]
MTDFVRAGRRNAHGARLVGEAARDIVARLGDRASAPPRAVGEAGGVASRRPWDVTYRRNAFLLDLVAGAAAAAAALAMWSHMRPTTHESQLLALIPVLWVGALAVTHGYERRYLGTATEEYRAVFHSTFLVLALVSVISYVLKLELSRGFIMTVLPMLFVIGMTERHLLRRRLQSRRARGLDVQRTVVIGDARSIGPLIREIRRAPGQGMQVVAACVSGLMTDDDEATDVEGVPVFGYPEEAMSAVDLFDAEVVAVSADPDLCGHALRRLSWALEEREVDLIVAPGIFEVAGPRLSIRRAAGMPLLHVERPVMSGARRAVKKVVDRVLAVAAAVLALPLLLGIAFAVRLDSPGPVLFRQTRVGAKGEHFQMLKFRTMGVDAEARLSDLRGVQDAGNTVLYKMRRDPRVTRVGRVLRRYSLDELPQLINVLRGQMSLVGPRPPLPSEVEGYEPDAARRLRVQPGLTGLWQVSGRSDLTWEESLRLDLWYVDNWSLALDLQIIFRTARAVLRGTGAY